MFAQVPLVWDFIKDLFENWKYIGGQLSTLWKIRVSDILCTSVDSFSAGYDTLHGINFQLPSKTAVDDYELHEAIFLWILKSSWLHVPLLSIFYFFIFQNNRYVKPMLENSGKMKYYGFFDVFMLLLNSFPRYHAKKQSLENVFYFSLWKFNTKCIRSSGSHIEISHWN